MKRLLCLAVLALPGCDPNRLADAGAQFSAGASYVQPVAVQPVYMPPPGPVTVLPAGPGNWIVQHRTGFATCTATGGGSAICY